MDAHDEMIAAQKGDEPRADDLLEEIAKLREQLEYSEGREREWIKESFALAEQRDTETKRAEAAKAKLEEHQAISGVDIEKLLKLGWTPCVCDICGCSLASFKATPQFFESVLAQAREEGRREAVPEGWQVVPKEATIKMIGAGGVAKSDGEFLKNIYAAMLSAAPKPEEKP